MGPLQQRVALRAANLAMAVVPRRRPSRRALENCRIVSHRGEHDNRRIFENTLPAFRTARDAGVWGIECDLRWTADEVPVVFHDPDGERLFGIPRRVADLGLEELRRLMPQVPTLAELVAEFGGRTHLMLEIKAEQGLDSEVRKERLEQQLSGLVAERDYHILALDPDLLQLVEFIPARGCLLVAETNVAVISEAALARELGGLTGHFLLLDDRLKDRHEIRGQRVGTGFVTSSNCLFREINRGVEWIFTDHAVSMQAILGRALAGVKAE